MPDRIEIRRPYDAHVHFRQGNLLNRVVPYTASSFAGALVMPNTSPPIDNFERLDDYLAMIAEAASGWAFQAHLTLYLKTDFDVAFLERARPLVNAVKLYPRGLTTGSEHGVDLDDPKLLPVLEALEETGIPLCVHGEAPGYHEDREANFIPHLLWWRDRFPKLRIVLEHVADRRVAETALALRDVHVTITPHHLLLTGDDWCGDLLRPDLYCKPPAKRREDRDALNWLVLDSPPEVFRRVMLGTDSAPHLRERKQCEECCAGVFTAPIALQLLADLFDEARKLDRLQGFAADHAAAFYGLDELPDKTVVLERKPFQIPYAYLAGRKPDGDLVPMWAGRTLDWSIEDVIA